MKIAIIGAGNIGSILATQFNRAGHKVIISFSRNERKLKGRATKLGSGIQADSVAEAVRKSDVIILSCLWTDIDNALAQAGDLTNKIVVDVTNQYTPDGLISLPASVAEYNQARMTGARVVRSFNMFYADFLREVGNGEHPPVAMFYAAEDPSVKPTAEKLITDAGFAPVFIGGWDTATLIEAPEGIVLGKAYTPKDAQKIAQAIHQGHRNKARQLADKLAG